MLHVSEAFKGRPSHAPGGCGLLGGGVMARAGAAGGRVERRGRLGFRALGV